MKYLSLEWIHAANELCASAAASAPAAGVVIDQHVDGVGSYRVAIRRNDSSIRPVDDTDPARCAADASFSQSAATARSVAQGTTDAHQAFLLGHIRFEGDINVLIERREALTWLETTLAPLMAKTLFL